MEDRPAAAVLVAVLTAVLIGSTFRCRASESARRPVPSYYQSYGDPLGLQLTAAQMDCDSELQPVMDSEPSCFRLTATKICAIGKSNFMFTIEHTGATPLVLDLPNARYFDETKTPHSIYGFWGPFGGPAEWKREPTALSIEPNTREVFNIAAVEKVYYWHAAEDEDLLIHEVMIPWNVRDRSKEVVRQDQRRLLDAQAAVRLDIPLTIEERECRLNLMFKFVDFYHLSLTEDAESANP